MELENKILNLYEENYTSVRDQRIIDILKVILVDKETDINQVVHKSATTIQTIQKYIDEKKDIMKFLTQSEFEILKNRFEYLKKLNKPKKIQKKEEKIDDDIIYIKRLIDEIFNTRHKIDDICRNNYLPFEKVNKLFFETNFLNENYGIGMKEKIKAKISENDSKRRRLPRNCILIEDRWDIFVANTNIHYLNEIDFRKLKFASTYLCSGANLDYVAKARETDIYSVISILSDLKLQSILKPECYENLKRYIGIEKILINSELSMKKTLLYNVVHILNENKYDINATLSYFNLPVCLFNKLLAEILILPYFDENTKNNIKALLNVEEEKKVK